jgi:Effector-associated domain 11
VALKRYIFAPVYTCMRQIPNMDIKTLIEQLRDQIARNELPAVLTQLRTLLDNSPQLDEVLLQSGRFYAIRQQIRLGVVSHAEATLTQNQIRAGLLELLEEIGQSVRPTSSQPDTNAALREEVARAISMVNTKNVVVGSTITAGGNVHIGDTTTVNNEGATIKNQFNGGTFNNTTFE